MASSGLPDHVYLPHPYMFQRFPFSRHEVKTDNDLEGGHV